MNFPIPSESLTPARRRELLIEAGFTKEKKVMNQQVTLAICSRRPFDGLLTTDHASSSYGQPVLLALGNVYGPGDLIDGQPLIVFPLADSEAEIIDVETLFAQGFPVIAPEIQDWNDRVIQAAKDRGWTPEPLSSEQSDAIELDRR